MARQKPVTRLGIDGGKKRALQDTAPHSFATLILGAVHRTTAVTWAQYAWYLLNEKGLPESMVMGLVKWIDSAMPIVHAAGHIDPDVLLAVFEAAGRRVNGGYERVRDPRRVTDAQRLTRNYIPLTSLHRRGRLEQQTLEKEVEARILVPADRPVVERLLREAGVSDAGKINKDVLAAKLLELGLPVTGGHLLKLCDIVNHDLAALRTNADAGRERAKRPPPPPPPPRPPAPPPPAPPPPPPAPPPKVKRRGGKTETLFADHRVLEEYAGPWVHPRLAWRLFSHHWPGSSNPITNRAQMNNDGCFEDKKISGIRGLFWRLSQKGLALSEDVIPSLTPAMVVAWMREEGFKPVKELETEAPPPPRDPDPPVLAPPPAVPAPAPAPAPEPEPPPAPASAVREPTLDELKALLARLPRESLIEVLRPFVRTALVDLLAELVSDLRAQP